jgi:hypothetical protein
MSRLVPVALLVVIGSTAAQGPEPSPAIYLPPVASPGFKLLSQPAVQAELRLTARQKEAVMILTDVGTVSPHVWEAGSLGRVTPDLARAEIERQTKEFLDAGLTKEQRGRLDQIVFQLREKEFGAHAAFAMAARDLALRADQLEDVQNLKGLRVEEIAKHVTSGERFEKVKDKVSATNGDTFEKMAEMLTRTQRDRLTELKGKPFAGKGDEARLHIPRPEDRPPPPRYPAHLFGLYDLELRYLASATVRSELKVSDDQAALLDGAIRVWKIDSGKVEWDKLHELTELVLAHHLTPVQRTRLDQIMLQRRERASPELMCGHPAAVAALRLSPIQLQKLRDGQSVNDVLTRDQLARRGQLLGTPFELPKVDDPVLSPPAVARVEPSKYAFARNFLVLSDRLKLSPDQIRKLRELAEDEPKIKDLIRRELSFADTPPVAGAARGLSTALAVMDQYQAAVERQCWKVLDDQQQSLARQVFGRRR